MRRHLRLLLIVCGVALAPAFWPDTAQANHWRYRRSWYGAPVYGAAFAPGASMGIDRTGMATVTVFADTVWDGPTEPGVAMVSACLAMVWACLAMASAATRRLAMVSAMEACL